MSAPEHSIKSSTAAVFSHSMSSPLVLLSLSAHRQTFNYNAMESLYLVTSLFILLAGMAFQSGVTAEGSGSHTSLTWAVALVLVACVSIFVGMLALEVYRSYRFARRAVAAVQRVVQAGKRRLSIGTPAASGGAAPVAGSAVSGSSGSSGLPMNGGVVNQAVSAPPAVSAVSRSHAAEWVTNPLRRAGPRALTVAEPATTPPPPPPPPAMSESPSSFELPGARAAALIAWNFKLMEVSL